MFSLCRYSLMLLIFQLPYRLYTASPPSLNGRVLSCCSIEKNPVIVRSENENQGEVGLDGMAIRYLKKLQKKLNFTCSSNPLNRWDKIGYVEFIDQMHACVKGNNATVANRNRNLNTEICKCELVIGGWIKTDYAVGLVDFAPSFARDRFRVVVHDDSLESLTKGPFFLTPFSPAVWGCFFGLILTFSLLKVLDVKFFPSIQMYFSPLPETAPWHARALHFLVKHPVNRRFRLAVESVLETIISRSDRPESHSTRHWTLNFVILLSGLFMILTFEAALTANLIHNGKQSPYSSIEDFNQCRNDINISEVCIRRGGTEEQYWNNNVAKMPCHKKRTGYGVSPMMVETHEEGFERLLDKRCKFLFCDSMTAAYATRIRHCGQLVTTGTPLEVSSGLAFILPLGSKYLDDLSIATLELFEENALETTEKYVDDIGGCEERDEGYQINLSDVSFFFVTAYGLSFVLWMLMLCRPQAPPWEREASETGAGDARSCKTAGSGYSERSSCTEMAPSESSEETVGKE